jgi:hypothetical protein
MPQPIRRVKPRARRKVTDVIEHPTVLLQRPHLGALIAAIAAQSTRLENLAALTFCDMLSAEEQAALVIYLAFVERGPREVAFNAVAKLKLPPALQARAKQLHDCLRGRLKERNEVVHGTWAISLSLPDSLLLTDAKPILEHRMKTKAKPEQPVMMNHGMAVKFRWMEYKERDFKDILARLQDFEFKYKEF